MSEGEASSLAATRPVNPTKKGSEEHATNAMVAPDLKHDDDGPPDPRGRWSAKLPALRGARLAPTEALRGEA
jgi:hypothetical protein